MMTYSGTTGWTCPYCGTSQVAFGAHSCTYPSRAFTVSQSCADFCTIVDAPTRPKNKPYYRDFVKQRAPRVIRK